MFVSVDPGMTSLSGRILEASGISWPHMCQILAFCGAPTMTLCSLPAFLMMAADLLMRSMFSSQNSSWRYVPSPACNGALFNAPSTWPDALT